jgi:serine phosphatase RsbU (regulator of sigma subunit)
MNRVFFIIVLISYSASIFGQSNLDSLWRVWDNIELTDTTRVNALDQFIWKGYVYNNPDSAIFFSNIAEEFSLKNKIKKGQINALRAKGSAHHLKGDFDIALSIFNSGLKICKSIGDKKIEAKFHISIGNLYELQGNYELALASFKESLELSKKIEDKAMLAIAKASMANIRSSLGNYEEALNLYFEAIKVGEEINNNQLTSGCYTNVANIYNKLENYEQAIMFYNKSIDISKKLGYKQNLSNCYGNLGVISMGQKDYENAMIFYIEALNKSKEVGDKRGMARMYNNFGHLFVTIGSEEANRLLILNGRKIELEPLVNSASLPGTYYYEPEDFFQKSLVFSKQTKVMYTQTYSNIGLGRVFSKKNQEDKAIPYYLESYNLANEIGNITLVVESSELLYNSYKEVGNNLKALEMHEVFVEMRDSMNSEKNQKELIRQEYKYSYERQAILDSLKHIEAQRINEVQIAKQGAELKNTRLQQYLLFGGLGIAALFSIYFIRKNRQIKEQKRQVNIQKEIADRQRDLAEKQKDVLSHQHREIKDSIQYAHNLQKSALPSVLDVSLNFPNNFVLYKPKDVVSGDFYWTYSKNGLDYLAVVDCTGHGVPGAFMTIIANNLLNEIIQDDFETPKSIIEELHKRIKIKVGGHKDAQVRDSMDLGLFSVNKKTNKILFVGTHTSLSLVRNSKLETIKGSKADIGYKATIELTEHEVNVQENDMLYMHSDGFPDQKGGPKGKKFYYQPIRDKFEEISLLNLMEQEQIMDKTFEDWKGELEQLDDVCMIGVRI